ncbi:MATE family efflux transporter [Streptomyces sp. 71268]|uniref:MATE family efflux transporter n=1 Tax=Streptomyces sp. 71268 TaxID=3002640 RepID=UPI0023F9B379|nr:MATE family efflux transporter [Streptomyces sp. 71268]WEV25618.1 MATE family efflux transporter [Streptomyces sp. 71268]
MKAAEHRRALVSLAGPIYCELLSGVVAGIINMVWVARLGGAAVAAVAVATNVENVLLGVALAAGSGTTVLVARASGAGDPAGLRAAVRGGWALWALITPTVTIGGYLCREPLAHLVLGGADSDSLALATDYFSIALPGIAVFFATNVVDGILKGTGDTRTPMRLALLANGLILALDPWLILDCDLGVRGAAIATVLGRTAALVCGCVVLRRGGTLRWAADANGRGAPTHGAGSLRRRARSLGRDARRTASVGLPVSVDFVLRMTGALTLVAVVARLGVAEAAGYGIATKATYVATMAFYAVRQSAAIHTARLLGAGRDERRAIGRQALLLAGALGAAASLTLLAAGPWIMRAFGAEGVVIAAGALYLRWIGPYLTLLACCIALGGVFEGSGDSSALARVTAVGVALQLGLAYGLSGAGLPGVCGAMAASMAVQCAAVARRYRRTERPAVARRGRRRPKTSATVADDSTPDGRTTP